VEVEQVRCLSALKAQRQSLRVALAEDVLGHGVLQCARSSLRCGVVISPSARRIQQDFRFTSWSEQLTPATLSMASVLIRPPESAYSIRAFWVKRGCHPRRPHGSEAELHRSARVIGFVTDLGVALRMRLDEGTDAAVPKKVDRRTQEHPNQLIRCESLRFDVERFAHLCDSRIRLADRAKTPPPSEMAAGS